MFRALEVEITRRSLSRSVKLSMGPCRGLCAAGAIVAIQPQGVLYAHVQAEDVPEIVEETVIRKQVVPRLVYQEPAEHQSLPSYADMPLFSKQVRIALHNCGLIDPEKIEDYIARDGYGRAGQGPGGTDAR